MKLRTQFSTVAAFAALCLLTHGAQAQETEMPHFSTEIMKIAAKYPYKETGPKRSDAEWDAVLAGFDRQMIANGIRPPGDSPLLRQSGPTAHPFLQSSAGVLLHGVAGSMAQGALQLKEQDDLTHARNLASWGLYFLKMEKQVAGQSVGDFLAYTFRDCSRDISRAAPNGRNNAQVNFLRNYMTFWSYVTQANISNNPRAQVQFPPDFFETRAKL